MNLPVAVRRALDWHEDPRLIAWAATPVGRVAMWTATALLLPNKSRLLVLPLLALFLVFPERRTDLLALGALWILFDRLPDAARVAGPLPALAGMLLVLGVLWVVFRAARDFRKLPKWIQRYPVVILHVSLYGSVGLAYALPRVVPLDRGSLLWVLVTSFRKVVPFLVWRCGYMILAGKRGSAAKSRFRDHLFYCLPVWGGTLTPFGKGHDYLQQTRAKTREEIGAVQLAGLKLLALAWIWTAAQRLLRAGLNGEPDPGLSGLLGGWHLEVPTLARAIAAGGKGELFAGALWVCLGIELIAITLDLAISGHFIIGSLRLFGFRVFRNTYKPLLATSLLDFWNRFYYYFKELLVEFFFFPTYLTTFRRWPRVRIFAATMAAAGAGNLYYHLMRDFGETFLVPPGETASRLACRLLYSLLLGLGIFASMLREQKRRGKPAPPAGRWAALRRLRAIAGVWLFYALIHIWSVKPATLGFADRGRFFLSLLGL